METLCKKKRLSFDLRIEELTFCVFRVFFFTKVHEHNCWGSALHKQMQISPQTNQLHMLLLASMYFVFKDF
jgi:hypothetical protein